MQEEVSARTKRMETVRGLIAKAESLGTGPEADSFRQKAEALMAQHQIEMWELAHSGPKRVGLTVEKRTFDLYDGDMDMEVRKALREMFTPLAVHCRCLMGSLRWDKADVVGYPDDLDYADMLYTSLRLEMMRALFPKADINKPKGENVHVFKCAGYGWAQMQIEFIKVGWMPEGEAIAGKGADGKKVGYRMYQWYKKWLESQPFGEEAQVRVDNKVFRTSFIIGFADEIKRRLADMKRAKEEAEAASSNGQALVLMKDHLLEAFWEMYPDLKPHESTCECNTCHYYRHRYMEDVGNCSRQFCKDQYQWWLKNRRAIQRAGAPKEARVSEQGKRLGVSAAATADLNGSRNTVSTTTKGAIDA